MKKFLTVVLIVALGLGLMAGCTTSEEADDTAADFDATNEITVISREEGSGTRGAFIELVGLEQEDANGEDVDMTTVNADIANGTAGVMTNVQGNEYAIGYISLGSLNDTVKAVTVDGVEASVANILSGDYSIARPFNIATLGEVSANAQDFIDFIMSADGQAIVEEEGYIPVSDNAAYEGSMDEGKVVLVGSTSVSPVMEKIAEAYNVINPNVTIEIQAVGSTAGMTGAIDGICDIGMASRELKDSELEAGLAPTVIAKDGIAVVVNNANTVDDLSVAEILDIFMGTIATWDEVQ